MAKLNGTILIVDDDQELLYKTKSILKHHFKEVLVESSPSEIAKHLRKNIPEVVVLDMHFTSFDPRASEGLEFLRKVKKLAPQVKVIMHTEYGDISLAVAAMKEGATDFITKPWEPEKFLATLKNVFILSQQERELNTIREREKALRRDLAHKFGQIIYHSPGMRSVYDTIRKAAHTDANILITGEPGAGKEHVARILHRKSTRKNNHFLKADLLWMEHHKLEEDLFGQTLQGGSKVQPGRFELASGGTLFLNGIDQLPITTQEKILGVLQNREIVRVGAALPTPIDIRLLCATHENLDVLCERGDFKTELLYRINTVVIKIPPLREREEDIIPLANYFLEEFIAKHDKKNITITEEAQAAMLNYPWPGNVKELKSAIERAVITAIQPELGSGNILPANQVRHSEYNAKNSINITEVEKETIQKAIRKNQGNMSSAARDLGMSRSTLYRKMHKYGLE